MLLKARMRLLAAGSTTLLALGAIIAALAPATASATIAPPVALPGVSTAVPAAAVPSARASSRCRGAGSRRASSAVLRRAMLCLVNQTRAGAGLGSFRGERHLARAASRHAADMARRNYFAHVSPSGKSPMSRARAAGWRGGVGEVIAWGCGSLATPRAILRAWLNSPPHRAIVLGGGRAAGVGVKKCRRLRRPRPLGDGRRLDVALLEVEPRCAVLPEREVERSRPLDLVDPLLRSRERSGLLAAASPLLLSPRRPAAAPDLRGR